MFTNRKAFLLAAFVLALAVTPEYVQAAQTATAQQTLEATPLCDPDLIDGTFTFASLPSREQTVSLHFQNKSNAACRLQGQAGPSFGVDGHSMHVANCWLCDPKNTPSHAPEQQPGNQILLAPGERAALDLHWASTGESCQWADDVVFFVHWAKPTGYLFVPSNWPMHICSAVKSAGYRAEANSRSSGEETTGLLHVSVTPVIYSDERATLHVEMAPQKAAVASPDGCASLYTVRHGPSTLTRFEPLSAIGSSYRPSYTPEQIEEDKERPQPYGRTVRSRRCDMTNGQTTADADITAADLAGVTHIELRTDPGPGEDPVFLTATTHFTVVDVETLAPNWGDQVKGIRAGLSIDRVSFRLGEQIPVHLRWENVNATMPLAQGECMEPEPELEIQDSQHHVLRTIPMLPMCAGHGWGPFAIPKGKPQRTFIALPTAHGTPRSPLTDVRGELFGPGVYYIVSVWSAAVLDLSGDEQNSPRIGSGRFGKVYATARSLPVRIEVTPANNP